MDLGLTSGFMEAECDVSIEAQTEVIVEDVDGELKQQKSGGQKG